MGEKWLYHMIRVLYDAGRISRNEAPIVWKKGDEHKLLMLIREGKMRSEDVVNMAKGMISSIRDSEPWPLPDEGDRKLLNDWLLGIRLKDLTIPVLNHASRMIVAPHEKPDKIHAPWTDDQVMALNDWQNLGIFEGIVHEYTCGKCSKVLVATSDGWICSTDSETTEHCGYTQNWAQADTADPDVIKQMRAQHEKLMNEWGVVS